MKLDVRPARVEEIGPLVDVLRTTGLGANVGRLLRYPIESPTGDVLAAVAGDEVVGGAAVAGFGTTGWIGALGVASRFRRRGIGTALLRRAMIFARNRFVSDIELLCMPENAAMRRVAAHLGLKWKVAAGQAETAAHLRWPDQLSLFDEMLGETEELMRSSLGPVKS